LPAPADWEATSRTDQKTKASSGVGKVSVVRPPCQPQSERVKHILLGAEELLEGPTIARIMRPSSRKGCERTKEGVFRTREKSIKVTLGAERRGENFSGRDLGQIFGRDPQEKNLGRHMRNTLGVIRSVVRRRTRESNLCASFQRGTFNFLQGREGKERGE